ncbi:protein of unknown function [Pseudomonas mediterranea]
MDKNTLEAISSVLSYLGSVRKEMSQTLHGISQ